MAAVAAPKVRTMAPPTALAALLRLSRDLLVASSPCWSLSRPVSSTTICQTVAVTGVGTAVLLRQGNPVLTAQAAEPAGVLHGRHLTLAAQQPRSRRRSLLAVGGVHGQGHLGERERIHLGGRQVQVRVPQPTV